ncbi:MAG: DUF4920 domain-containing protein [Planctomycetes bacterium]|nr:DUF4920 domain-containing protein [Planctomycetota bacterium]
MRILTSAVVLSLLFTACSQETAAKENTNQPAPNAATGGSTADAAKKLDETKYDHFGDGVLVSDVKVVAAADLLKDPAAYEGKTVRVEGPITAVCQTKGCWMHLNSETEPVMVKFKDYGFFMPKDASGRTAILDGVVKVKQETVEETKHYLEDAGKTEEAAKITEGRKIPTVVASGVALTKPAK